MSIKTPALLHRLNYKFVALAIFCSAAFTACQPTEEKPIEEATTVNTQVTAADTTEPRPAPEFYFIPKELQRKRVWICEDNISDVFHVSNSCEALKGCFGTFRNVILPRAIEDFGRYNCEICSKELGDIFDQDKVRDM